MKNIQLFIRQHFKTILIIGAILILALFCHAMTLLTSKLTLAGLLMSKPEAGYVWKDDDQSDSRFFLQNSDVKWLQGTLHSAFNAQAGQTEGIWEPQAGYQFVDKAKNLETVWTPGLLHPEFQAWSDTGEGLWIPATGYQFVYEGEEFVATFWDPNKRYEDLKIISLPKQDSFIPFQGYQFVEPGKTFEVVWTPGLVNTDNPKLVSRQREGSWDVNYRPYRSGNNNDWLAREVARRVIWRVL